jgi:hypothetical protein
MALVAGLTIDPPEAGTAEQFVAVCTVTNVGDEAVSINVAPLSSPSLALEIQDASGGPVYLPPPPVPPPDPPTAWLEPGQGTTAEFGGFLPSWTEPGAYRARCRYVAGPGEPIRSAWIEFVLRR